MSENKTEVIIETPIIEEIMGKSKFSIHDESYPIRIHGAACGSRQ